MLTPEQLVEALKKKPLIQRDVVLVALAVDVNTPKPVGALKKLVSNAGHPEVATWNVTDVLRKAKKLTVQLRDGWCLTSRGRTHVEGLDVFPPDTSLKVVNQTAQLRSAAATIGDENTRKFVNEAVNAYEGALYRSAVVLSWVGAMALLYKQVVINSTKLTAFNSEAARRDARWRPAVSADDLGRMKESDFLDIIGAPPLSIIGKNLKEELKNVCLNLRNSCGHPNSLEIGEHRTAAHLEVLIQNIFTKFS